MKDVLLEIINEAKNGQVIIDNEEWPISFNTKIYDDNGIILDNSNDFNMSLLEIKQIDELVLKLEEYVLLENKFDRKTMRMLNNDDYNRTKCLVAYLFCNATTEDFREPVRFVNKYCDFLKDKTFESFNDSVTMDLDGVFDDCDLIITNSKQANTMETPYKMEFKIKDKNSDDSFILPEISYGISNGTCFIYSSMNKDKNKDKSKFQKKISRKLYKINEGVFDSENDEFKAYKNGDSDYYPENISDVSVSSVLSLDLFMNLLKNKDIDTVKVVSYLPLRYLSREMYANTDEKRERNQDIQYNATNKFIRSFMRLDHHLDFINVETLPYEIDEYLTISVKDKDKDMDDMLNNVNKSVDKEINAGKEK